MLTVLSNKHHTHYDIARRHGCLLNHIQYEMRARMWFQMTLLDVLKMSCHAWLAMLLQW